MNPFDQLTEKQLINLLQHNFNYTCDIPQDSAKSQPNSNDYRKASVLIPFVKESNQWHIVFIRRAVSDKDRHSGQVAFVGGKKEEFDQTDFETALRETQEEIGVKPSDVTILGQLGSHYSISKFQVTPVVATIPWPYNLTLDPNEVNRVFTIPLAWLADKNNHEIKQRQLPESNIKVSTVYFKKYEGELLWGATARMMLSLLNQIETSIKTEPA